jgi:hypothetical protein
VKLSRRCSETQPHCSETQPRCSVRTIADEPLIHELEARLDLVVSNCERKSVKSG